MLAREAFFHLVEGAAGREAGMPRHEDIDWTGLVYPAEDFYNLMAVGRVAGQHEAHQHEELFDRFFDRLPKEFIFERELLRSRLWRSPDRWSTW